MRLLLRTALARLGATRVLPAEAVAQLDAAYVYLRRLENRLQMLGDAQVHALPVEPSVRERIALAMGARDWPALVTELEDLQRSIGELARMRRDLASV